MPSRPRSTSSLAARAPESAAHGAAPSTARTLLAGLMLLVLVFAIYAPVLSAGFIWDDTENVVTNETLRTADGLRQMWFVPRSIQQYYPLMYTSYWVEYHLWGLDPRGYHVVNIVLHAIATLLVWRLLRRLGVPGAWLAAALFAVHPVMVESVAWVTERKNVLSLSLALGSLLCFVRYAGLDRPGEPARPPATRRGWYAAALATFVLALFAKTVVVTLPPVLLVILWWKHGRLTRQDFLSVIPFVMLAVALGMITTWMETYHLGARGKDWLLTPVERLLLAGRALWFYAGKLAWPYPLAFFYPRFTIDARVWWQYAFPLAALAVPVSLWWARGQIGRGPLAAVLIYAGVLMPMLGFFNIYFALYAQVSDHFQYHASIALFALAAAGMAMLVARLTPTARWIAYAGIGCWLVVLSAMSWRQTRIYHDLETLYRDTIAKNPQGTIAYSNLGVYYSEQGQYDEAIELAREVLRLDPRDPLAATNLAVFLFQRGKRDGFQAGELDEAVAYLRQGLQSSRDTWGAAQDEPQLRVQLATALVSMWQTDQGRTPLLDEAIAELREALRLKPDYAAAEAHLAVALAAAQRPAEAVEHAGRAVQLEPLPAEGIRTILGADLLAEGYHAYGSALAGSGQLRRAAEQFAAAVAARPDFDRALNNLGVVLMNLGETARAIHYFEEAVQTNPDYAEAKANLDKARQVRDQQRQTPQQ